MTKFLSFVHALVWGAPALILILGVGLYLMLRLGFAPVTLLPRAFGILTRRLRQGNAGGVSPAGALCTALAATVGTGNLVGVAGALCLGGPGAIFWMWICGLLGMATKYAEAVLAVRFQVKTEDGCVGGPMYVMTRGMGGNFRPMARLYCLFGLIAAFGVGNAAQISSAVAAVDRALVPYGIKLSPLGALLMGLLLALVIGRMLFGGARGIVAAAQYLVPLGAGVCLLLCGGVLTLCRDRIPSAFAAIVQGAFCPRAVTGGLLGSSFQALRIGCSRGVFTNEAGMGTAAIAHGSAEAVHPAEQGLMGILEVFLDTIVSCTMTALAILVSGVEIPYGTDVGAELTSRAFCHVLGPWAGTVIALCLVLFASATVLGWSLYAGRCGVFLFGPKVWDGIAMAQVLVILLSSVADSGAVWQFSETVNGLMSFPNLLTLAALTPEVLRLTREYTKSDGKTVSGGHYANFHQRKPLRTLSHEKVPPAGSGCQKSGKENLSPEYRSA